MLRAYAVAVVLVSLTLGLAIPAGAQAPRVLNLKFSTDGLVTLTAQNVTVRDILAEWARQCGCYVVNADQLAGAPIAVPISFESAAQPDVLRSLLRETGGYALTPRRAGSTSISQYETIYIINASAPVRYAAAVPAAPPIVIRGAPDDEIPPVMPIVVGAEPPAPGLPPAEQASSPPPAARPATPAGGFVITPVSPTPTPPGTAVPGTPTAPAPGQPPSPGQPTQPGRVSPAPQP
jgi:hypothetical protein